jgi:hypothetical protein
MPGHSGSFSPHPTDSRYEDLWVAVAAAFRVKAQTPATPTNIKIHVDNYRYELFGSIRSPETWAWGPYLLGHTDKCQRLPGVADHTYEGHLTQNPHTTFHSCDSLGGCPVRDNAHVVQIIPVTNHAFSIDNNENPPRPVEVVDLRSNSPGKANDLNQKREGALQGTPKTVKGAVLKEPGHTLLAQSWWVRGGMTTRPPIVAPSGEPLSYYIVLSSYFRDLTYSASPCHDILLSMNYVAWCNYSILKTCVRASKIHRS